MSPEIGVGPLAMLLVAAGFLARRLWRAAAPEAPVPDGRAVADRAGSRLYEAVLRRDVTAAAEALMDGASANHDQVYEWEYGRSSEPVLHLACKGHDLEMVELLLSSGADPDAAYEKSAGGYFEVEPCLHAVAVGPIPTHLPDGGGPVTPRPVEIMRLLLESGADPNVPYRDRDDSSREIGLLGRVQGDPELVELLEKYGARM